MLVKLSGAHYKGLRGKFVTTKTAIYRRQPASNETPEDTNRGQQREHTNPHVHEDQEICIKLSLYQILQNINNKRKSYSRSSHILLYLQHFFLAFFKDFFNIYL